MTLYASDECRAATAGTVPWRRCCARRAGARWRHRLALALWAATLLAPLSGDAVAGEERRFDHLKCFIARDRELDRTVLHARLLPRQEQFGEARCRIQLNAATFCIDVEKRNVRFTDERPFPVVPLEAADASDFVCYRIQCPPDRERRGLSIGVQDQFGSRTVELGRPDFLCAPAEKR